MVSTSNIESKTSEDLLICLMVCRKQKRLKRGVLTDELAEAVRFELTNGCPLPVFKTGAIDHSATLPSRVCLSKKDSNQLFRLLNLRSQ